MTAIRSTSLALLATVLLLFGCSHKLKNSSSAQPTVKDTTLTYCNADQTFVVEGTGLSPLIVDGATKHPDLRMPKVCLQQTADVSGQPVTGVSQVCLKNENVGWASQRELHFTLHPGDKLTPGTYDVVVTNPDGKVAKGHVILTVLPGEMLVFWSDPSIVYNGIATEPTVYGSNLGSNLDRDDAVKIVEVSIRDVNDFNNVTQLTDITPVGQHNSAVQATLAANQAVGTYDVVVKASNGCTAELAKGVQVVAEVDPTLVTAIDPTFGRNTERTSVTITGAGFQAIPRVYISPVQAGAGSVATALSSVAMKSDTTLTAVVPKLDPPLPPGAYNVIVVNPDGKVGVLQNLPGQTNNAGAFFVTSDPPPVVESISPPYITNQNVVTVTVDGSGFNTPTVTFTCKAPDGTTKTLNANVVGTPGATSFDASIDPTTLVGGTVCLVTVTNPDQSYYIYSAVGVSIPSANLNPMSAATDMTTARRAPAVAAGRATRSARFIYAIGGDDGSGPPAAPGAALSSVEATPIDVYGLTGTWFNQPVSLPGPRTRAGVTRIGNFLYLVGGNDGGAALDTVLRAEVLQSANAPKVVDLGARRGANPPDVPGGVGPGIWYYRVSAVYPPADASNPGGEGLPSDPVVVDLRERTDTIAITLYWENVPGAASYRVYRNPTGGTGENLDSVRLLKDGIDASTPYYEDGEGLQPGGDQPRPVGATGNWATLPNLTVPRDAAGVAAGRNPGDTTGATWYLYALGGVGLASTERLQITVAVDPVTNIESQTYTTWTAGANLSVARSELSGFSVSHVEASLVPAGTTWIYAGGGIESTNVDAAMIPAGGDLAWQAVKAMSPKRAGYAGLAGAGFLFAFGGADTTGTQDSITSAQINTPLPDFVNWNNNAERLVHPRSYAGSAIESAFIYIIGGISNGAVTATTERTVL